MRVRRICRFHAAMHAGVLAACATVLAIRPALATDGADAIAGAKPPQDADLQKAQAADLYDQAKRLYEQAEYSRAAQTFLEADALVPSSEALSNAIASARQAPDHLLTARAALRAIEREQSDPMLAARARAALTEAEQHLARLSASCAPEPCALFLNGQPLLQAKSHLLPGSYLLSMHSASGNAQSEPSSAVMRFTAEPGEEYTYFLQASEAAAQPPQSAQRPPNQPAEGHPASASELGSNRVLPPWTFWVGVGTAGVLAGLTTWSGIVALQQKGDLPSRYAADYETAVADLESSAQRTDWLLGASLLTAATTAAMGIWWVNWDSPALQVGAAPVKGGAEIKLRGRF